MTIDFDKIKKVYKSLSKKEKKYIIRGEFPHKLAYVDPFPNYAEHLELKRLCKKKFEKKVKNRRRIPIPKKYDKNPKKVLSEQTEIKKFKNDRSLFKSWIEKIKGRKK